MAQVTAGFHERFARCCSLLHFTARRILGCSAQAELAIRNCWLSASRNPPLFSHDGAFRSWLLRLMIDEALTIRRFPQRQRPALSASSRLAPNSSPFFLVIDQIARTWQEQRARLASFTVLSTSQSFW